MASNEGDEYLAVGDQETGVTLEGGDELTETTRTESYREAHTVSLLTAPPLHTVCTVRVHRAWCGCWCAFTLSKRRRKIVTRSNEG